MNSAWGVWPFMVMMVSGRGKGAEANSNVFIREYIDELTPIPRASVRSAMAVKPGDFSSERRA